MLSVLNKMSSEFVAETEQLDSQCRFAESGSSQGVFHVFPNEEGSISILIDCFVSL